jgi:hypothetical protein
MIQSKTLEKSLSETTLNTTDLPPMPQLMAAQENDGNKVVRDTLLGPRSKPVSDLQFLPPYLQE